MRAEVRILVTVGITEREHGKGFCDTGKNHLKKYGYVYPVKIINLLIYELRTLSNVYYNSTLY